MPHPKLTSTCCIASLSFHPSSGGLRWVPQPCPAQATRAASVCLLHSKYSNTHNFTQHKSVIPQPLASCCCLCRCPSLYKRVGKSPCVELLSITDTEKAHSSQSCWSLVVHVTLAHILLAKEGNMTTTTSVWVEGLVSSCRWHALGYKLPPCQKEVGGCRRQHVGPNRHRNELK